MSKRELTGSIGFFGTLFVVMVAWNWAFGNEPLIDWKFVSLVAIGSIGGKLVTRMRKDSQA